MEPSWGFEEERVSVGIDANGYNIIDGDTVTFDQRFESQGYFKGFGNKERVKTSVSLKETISIDCKIDGFGAMKLKSEFVKKI